MATLKQLKTFIAVAEYKKMNEVFLAVLSCARVLNLREAFMLNTHVHSVCCNVLQHLQTFRFATILNM